MSKGIGLTKKGFIAFLKERPTEVVGESRIPSSCPLARYSVAQGYFCATVDVTYSRLYTVDDTRERLWRMPKWASSFIQDVDRVGFGRSLTGRQCLEILDRAYNVEYEAVDGSISVGTARTLRVAIDMSIRLRPFDTVVIRIMEPGGSIVWQKTFD